MDLARVVEMLERVRYHGELSSLSAEVPASRSGMRFVGNELLRCGACDGPIGAENRSRVRQPDPLRAEYRCQNLACAAVRVPVRVIDQELQAFTVRRWSQPGFATRWRPRPTGRTGHGNR